MLLRDLLYRIGDQYDPAQGTSSDVEPQRLLRQEVKNVVQPLLPIGYTAQGRGGSGTAADVPWIAVFDDDETNSAQRGMYIVYLFSTVHRTISLTLIQGVSEVSGTSAQRRSVLASIAENIRSKLGQEISGLDVNVQLGSSMQRSIDYEHGTIVARTYRVDELPDENELSADLYHFIELYSASRIIRHDAGERHGLIEPPDLVLPQSFHRKPEFAPKGHSDVVRHIMERTLTTSRKHELLVKKFGQYLQGLGYEVATNVHPRDMTANRDDIHWLIEAKTISSNYVEAVRDALGQLKFYRYFLHSSDMNVRCLALFNQPISRSLMEFLSHEDIAVVYHRAGQWEGTARL